MREALHNFGAIALATKDTAVYSANSCDMGAVDSRFRLTKHTTGLVDGPRVVFMPAADFASIDGMIPFIQDSEDGSTWVTCLTGPEVTAPKAGRAYPIPLPIQHRRRLRAGCTPKSSGTFTAKSVSAWVEAGPQTDASSL